ncbi:hypothetical protein [Methanoregula sp.]|jgi:hypothetical protein|uniref:hypothetical protein n=1 Tax=Methanoregula sp. TaxID=2052170 RepID=UPI003C1E6B5B
MSCRVGFVWETPQHFSRYIEDCGAVCELVTPHMLAAPYFRGHFTCLIIPTGFGNAKYTNLLPALRASSSRIERFVENGGRLLVFGAAAEKPDAYDWLPFPVSYAHDFHPAQIRCEKGSPGAELIDDYDADRIECDGSFPSHGGVCLGTTDSADVIIEYTLGKGKILVTSVHEYPSREFLRKFCCEGEQTVF